eukprot:TRINITY_DN17173_c0_g1_i1.p1 TRINITY_DN17173_c0_g1~~TRINITY_DN17173_c0_g1_i1.p1  ORF type:complete len:102 (+),score=17.85 TRINITY_DN17173_c0_g1_i1:32-307(+)
MGQMEVWVNSINQQAQVHEEGPGKSQTLPPGSEKKDEPKTKIVLLLLRKVKFKSCFLFCWLRILLPFPSNLLIVTPNMLCSIIWILNKLAL